MIQQILKSIKKEIGSFVPQELEYNLQVLSSFDKKGIVGIGFNFDKSYFQLEFDFISSSITESVIHEQFSFLRNRI